MDLWEKFLSFLSEKREDKKESKKRSLGSGNVEALEMLFSEITSDLMRICNNKRQYHPGNLFNRMVRLLRDIELHYEHLENNRQTVDNLPDPANLLKSDMEVSA